MNTTFGASGKRLTASRSSRSQRILDAGVVQRRSALGDDQPDGDDAPSVSRAEPHSRQRRAHLTARAGDDDVARTNLQRGGSLVARR